MDDFRVMPEEVSRGEDDKFVGWERCSMQSRRQHAMTIAGSREL